MSNYSAELKAVTLEANTNIPEWIQGPQGPQGIPGKDGKTPIRGVDYWTPQDKQEVIDEAKQGVEIGAQGKSAYEVAVENGFVGTEQEWLTSLKGPAGKDGKNGVDGKQGPIGPQGNPGKDGTNGKDGLPGKEGKPGTNGTNGKDGTNGTDGFSPTIVVKDNTESTYTLTITDKNGSYNTPNLKGSGGGGGTGDNGATFTPSVSPEGIISWENDKGLKNPDPVDIKGPKGDTGDKGADGVNGKDGAPGKDGAEGKQGPQGEQGLPGKEGPQGPAGADGKQGPQGEPGKDGTNGTDGKDGAPGAKGDTGDSGVYRGSVEPVDESVKVWIDPNGTASDNLATEKYVDDAIAAIDIPDTTPIATTAIAGKVKPDGTTITVDEDGTIHGASGGGGGFPLEDRIAAGTGKCAVVLGRVETSPYNSEATGEYSLAVGSNSKATKKDAIALSGGKANGYIGIAHADSTVNDVGRACVALGYANKVQGDSSIALGYLNDIRTDSSYTGVAVGSANKCITDHAAYLFGISNKAMFNTERVFALGGYNEFSTNSKIYDSFALGNALIVKSSQQTVIGNKNMEDTANTYVCIFGNGTSGPESIRSNAYTLDWKGNGAFQGKVTSQGADYAEYFEWEDSNPSAEDRVGNIVTLDGDKIRYANDGDDILGVVSGTVGVLGDNYEWQWHNKYLTDDFGRVIYDMVEEFSEDPETHEKHSLGMFPHPRINPDYDESKPYTKRSDRPEWDAVGMMGKLYVKDDGTAKVNDYITACNGIATKALVKTNMRVMERVKPNIIRVLMR